MDDLSATGGSLAKGIPVSRQTDLRTMHVEDHNESFVVGEMPSAEDSEAFDPATLTSDDRLHINDMTFENN